MNNHQQEILGNLRLAAEQNDWNLCRETLRKLLPDVNQITVVQIIVKQVRRFLSDFARVHIEDEESVSSEKAFSHVISFETLTKQAILTRGIMEKYIDEPGVRNFIGALWRMSEFPLSAEVNGAVDVLSGLLMAINTHNWAYNRLGIRSRMIDDGNIHATTPAWFDPKSIELRKSLWIEIANDLDLTLQS